MKREKEGEGGLRLDDGEKGMLMMLLDFEIEKSKNKLSFPQNWFHPFFAGLLSSSSFQNIDLSGDVDALPACLLVYFVEDSHKAISRSALESKRKV